MKWREEDHPRDDEGKFTDRQPKRFKQNTSYDEILAEEIQIEGYIELPKREYAELCSAIRTEFTDDIPQYGQMLYGENYYQFGYDKSKELIVCIFKIQIEGNEKKIAKFIKEFK